jgi:hypothetical protein
MAKLARAGLTPNWMPGVMPRCIPVETKRNQHGEWATTILVGTEFVLTRGKWRTVEVLACPITWRSHPEQIAFTRRAYGEAMLMAWMPSGGASTPSTEATERSLGAQQKQSFCKPILPSALSAAVRRQALLIMVADRGGQGGQRFRSASLR